MPPIRLFAPFGVKRTWSLRLASPRLYIESAGSRYAQVYILEKRCKWKRVEFTQNIENCMLQNASHCFPSALYLAVHCIWDDS